MSGFPKAVTAARQWMKGLIVKYTPGLIPLYLENQRVRQPHRTLQQVQAALPASLAKEIFPSGLLPHGASPAPGNRGEYPATPGARKEFCS